MRPAQGFSDMDSLRFTKLNGQNYATWAIHMRSALQSKYLWALVKGKETRPVSPVAAPGGPAPSAEEIARVEALIDEWEAKDKAAQGLMYRSTDESQWPHVSDCKTAIEMWDTWKQIHQTNRQATNAYYHLKELFTKKYVDGTSMEDHIATMLNLRQLIIQAGGTIDDLQMSQALILSFPETLSWEIITVQLIHGERLTPDGVSTRLQAE